MAENRKKEDMKLVYLLVAIVIILSVAVMYLAFVKPAEVAPVVTSDEKAVEVQQDLSASISDIKDDLEQLKKNLGK